MHLSTEFKPIESKSINKRVVAAVLASTILLWGCGGGGNAGSDVLPDSVTVTSLDGPSGGTVGSGTTLNVKVTTTGGIAASELTYTWEQTAGTLATRTFQGDGDYQSTFIFTPLVTGSVTFKVTVAARGKTASQSKSVPINP